MYALIASAYIFCFPLLLLLQLLIPLKRNVILLRLRSSIQLSLIVYALYLVRQLIGLYQLRKLLKMPDNNLDFMGSGLLEMGLIVVLPFLFLYPRILNSWKLGLVIWVLLLHALQRQELIFMINGWAIVNALLFYFSLISAIYALLWLLKNQNSTSAL